MNKPGLKAKLIIVFIVVTTMVLASAFIVMVSLNVNDSRKNIISVLDIVGNIMADRCAASLAFSDVESANSNLRTLGSHASVVYACIRTSENQVFSEYNLSVDQVYRCEDYRGTAIDRFQDRYVDSFKPIVLEGQPIGSLQIKASLDEFNQKIVTAIQVSLSVFIGLIVIAIYVVVRITNHITDPITQLKHVAEQVTTSKDYSLRASDKSEDEVGVLVDSFNSMLEHIQERDYALLEEKEKAEKSALSAKRYAKETETINDNLENEIRERARIEEELQELNETLEEKVKERTAELKDINEKIGEISRSAGMAEVASGVLHNVGNVLNSVNVSASVIREQIRKTKAENLIRVVEMMDKNKDSIADFIQNNEKGKQIPVFLRLLAEQLKSERELLFKELDDLSSSIDHIKNVISMQQSYAGSYGVREQINIPDLIEDALKINIEGMRRRGIKVVKDYADTPLIYIDKHKVLQVIINLVSNAMHALSDSSNEFKHINVSVKKDDGFIELEVLDTGIGIAAEDIPHLFEYGFKKRRGGHGYGLHHSALVANELGGRIVVHSDGPGKGASFKLIIPHEVHEKNMS